MKEARVFCNNSIKAKLYRNRLDKSLYSECVLTLNICVSSNMYYNRLADFRQKKNTLKGPLQLSYSDLVFLPDWNRLEKNGRIYKSCQFGNDWILWRSLENPIKSNESTDKCYPTYNMFRLIRIKYLFIYTVIKKCEGTKFKIIINNSNHQSSNCNKFWL